MTVLFGLDFIQLQLPKTLPKKRIDSIESLKPILKPQI